MRRGPVAIRRVACPVVFHPVACRVSLPSGVSPSGLPSGVSPGGVSRVAIEADGFPQAYAVRGTWGCLSCRTLVMYPINLQRHSERDRGEAKSDSTLTTMRMALRRHLLQCRWFPKAWILLRRKFAFAYERRAHTLHVKRRACLTFLLPQGTA